MEQNLMKKKSLTRLRLVNWHYFEDETILFNGATLISGINASGKSTILDAIKMVLTVDTRHFNIAANENSKRDLMGYVRCKVGEDAKTFNREGVVISHVALEFFDEERKKTFVLGVVHTSNDEQSQILSKWYISEGSLEEIKFIIGNRPATPKELRSGLLLLERKDAREKFLARLGHLEEKFFDMIKKAIAFKPMKNVKDFIKSFLLPESNIDFESLRETIDNVRKLEDLYNQCVKQKNLLDEIVRCGTEYRDKQYEILVDEILMNLADYDIARMNVKDIETKIDQYGRDIDRKKEDQKANKNLSDDLKERLESVKDALKNSDTGRIVLSLEKQIEQSEKLLSDERRKFSNLKSDCEKLKIYLKLLKDGGYELPITSQEFFCIYSENIQLSEKEIAWKKLFDSHEILGNDLAKRVFELETEKKALDEDLVKLGQKKISLEKRQHTYPEKADRIKRIVEQEFNKRGIESTICYLCELLEIKNESWRNAIEGFLDDKRFALVVDAKYFNVAFEVFQKNKIDSSLLLNSSDIIKLESAVENGSLAEYIECKNSLSSTFIALVAGSVHCCNSVSELLNYKASVAENCAAYLDDTLHYFPTESFSTPYIGMKAYEIQLEKVKNEIQLKKVDLENIKPKLSFAKKLKDSSEKVNYEAIRNNMDSPFQCTSIKNNIASLEQQKKDAESNPDFIQLGEKKQVIEKHLKEIELEGKRIEEELIDLKSSAKSFSDKLVDANKTLENTTNLCGEKEQNEPVAYSEAVQKYSQHLKSKSPETTKDNFSRRLVALKNETDEMLNSLKGLQSRYNIQFTSDIPEGMVAFNQYIDVQNALRNVVIKDRQSNLENARKQSEEIFKEDFLVKMRDMIRKAKHQFRELNECLRQLDYGGDTYYFTITSNREKDAMYKMIMDDNNMGSESLWTASFEQTYQQELADLYGKLLSDKDSDNKIVQEYSDYRNYLDFDIKIHKPNGGEITYSKVVGEKSGAETQIPFYVAMAASFYILYNRECTIRLILFDEAFEKMDESRIGSMMQFLRFLNLQTVLVTPPEKIESIGNHVDSVLAVCRDGECSYVMDYGYEKEIIIE